MRFSRFSAAAFLLIASACVHAPAPPRAPVLITVYHCGEAKETAEGRFEAEPNSVAWWKDLDDGMRIGFHLNLEESDHADFAANGFNSRRFDHPVVFVDFYRDRSWLDGVDDHVDTVWEIRIGDRVMRRWAPVNMVAPFNWREAQLLLEGAGDWRFTLYNTKAGVLQQATLPRDALFDVERTLQRMHARVLEKLREKETLCRSEQVEESTEGEIVLTH